MSDKPASPFARLDTSLLRPTRDREESVTPEPTPLPTPQPAIPEATTIPRAPDTTRPRDRETKRPRSHDTATLRHRDTAVSHEQAEVVDRIRRTVRVVGKEAATLRLTAEEKAHLADVIYSYKRKGKRTSETEIIRIALNYVLEDLEQNGGDSILSRVMDALDS